MQNPQGTELPKHMHTLKCYTDCYQLLGKEVEVWVSNGVPYRKATRTVVELYFIFYIAIPF